MVKKTITGSAARALKNITKTTRAKTLKRGFRQVYKKARRLGQSREQARKTLSKARGFVVSGIARSTDRQINRAARLDYRKFRRAGISRKISRKTATDMARFDKKIARWSRKRLGGNRMNIVRKRKRRR